MTQRLLLFITAVASLIIMPDQPAHPGWYTDSLKTAPIIEIRGESADTTTSKATGDRYIQDNLGHIFATNEWVIVNFCAYWCPDCNKFMPAFAKASKKKEYRSIRWAVADVDGVRGNESFRKRFNLPGTPTVILFHHGEIQVDHSGSPASPAIFDGSKGDKTYNDLIAFLKSYYHP